MAILNNQLSRVPQRTLWTIAAAFIIVLGLFYFGSSHPAVRNPASWGSLGSSTTPSTNNPPTSHEDSTSNHPAEPEKGTTSSGSTFEVPSHGDLPCKNLPGAEDVVVVMKTGSTEFADKVPVHITSTLRCYQNFMIFSDYEEEFQGVHIYDALESIEKKYKDSNAEFELWRRLQQAGRSVLKPEELSGPISQSQVSKSGKGDNPGWKLDKWKFLPMSNRTLHEHPNAKWYVFIETDTYVFWQTLLNYLHALDWTSPFYLGSQIFLGDIMFAHGGTGYVLSRPALEAVVKLYEKEQSMWDKFVDEQWAGDAVLGKALKDSGAKFVSSWGIFQGEEVGSVPYEAASGDRNLWCTPSVSYHHLSPPVVEDMWKFEQEWIAGTNGDASQILRHKDVFNKYTLPRMTAFGTTKRKWDNGASSDRGAVATLDECRQICESESNCVQFKIDLERRCMVSGTPGLGEWARGFDSGWLVERVKQWESKMPSCSGSPGWISRKRRV